MATSEVSVSQSIEPRDFPLIAEAIVDELRRREQKRRDLEAHWKEIDRQLRMEPECSHKLLSNGQKDPRRAWMPEVELPLQAQTLEMLMADVRRMIFPANRDWFQARAALTDQYIKRFNDAGSPFPGERSEKGDGPRAVLNQDNGDRLAQAVVSHWHSQYDFRAHIDVIHAQALAYGFGVGRLKKVRRRVLGHDARLTGFEDQRIPVYLPRDVKKVYLDDSMHAVMHEGHSLGPNILQKRTMKYADLVAQAEAGGTNPKSEEGGFILSEIKRLTPKEDGTIDLVELEGDLVIERSSETIIEQDVIVTAAVGAQNGKDTFAFIRYREGEKFSSYIIHEYHREGPGHLYGASPLLKGMPVAKAAAQAMNRVIESAQLKNSPPIGYSRDDMAFAHSGGPVVAPYAQWPTTDELKAYTEVGGEPAQLWGIFAGLVQLYTDVTGVNPPRLGAQTKSHTTAFAKDVELSQGAVRTVDFVRSVLEGPMTRLLQLEYRMGLSLMRGRQTLYVEQWNEFVTVKRDHLPDIVKFTAIGSGAPAEDLAKSAQRQAAAQMALQIDSFAVSLGREPKIDHGKLIEQVLNDGGWTDVSAITRPEESAEGAEPQPGMGVVAGMPGILSQGNPTMEAIG